MTSVDDLFKKPGLPSGNLKRKLEVTDAEAAYKATKISNGSSPNGTHANIDDAPEDDDDLEAGPELPPDDDEGGEDGDRFFGGGVTKATASALDYIDEQDAEDLPEEKIDSSWLRRLAVSFEKKVKKNSEQRARYESEPQKFMASEADLDAEIQNWSLLSEHPELYSEFAHGEACGLLVGLLAHENTDIAIRAIEIISELLDEDVEAEQEQWDGLANALLDADLLDLLMSNLGRLQEDEESDQSGIYHSLSVMESLAGQQLMAESIGKEKVLMWLCNRIKVPEKICSQNKQYAAEVLQVLLQSSSLLRKRFAVDVDGVDLFLQLLAPYRKRDPPKDSTEEEYAENIFDALICVANEPNGKRKLIEAEGVELALIMVKEGSFSKIRALRLLDHACDGQDAAAMEVCERFVEAGGLKTTFGAFMKKSEAAPTEHLLGMFASLLRLLPAESAARIRTLAKFAEKDYEKVDRLFAVRQDYVRSLGVVEKEIRSEQSTLEAEEAEERADEFFSRRMEGGLYGLQTTDTILAWLVAEDTDAKKLIATRLGGLGAVKMTLQEEVSRLDALDAADQAERQEMLKALFEYVV
ncbi:hypothetical protein LTR78_002054 [Recurvomyces mirabilis]|uniref:Beta-catenin-like protein 1 N-terminal domain-containing protein n=1 Tax=Recurvomyces mirabilis TaxID=574656 RepID=A0AAE1C4J4_9PEZI|nr:hypothetical protein LTR78_002054 [Recurvomyces mirabilis]KAK5160512.1 hypothetical protein LTS14_001524 [Recurvomyces mirabilis]